MKLRFYEYSQNNSGGSFDVDKNLCHRIIIEAESCVAADAKLESLGGYFDGCAAGLDCDCCGDRWHPACNAIELPNVWGGLTQSQAEKIAETYKVNARKSKEKSSSDNARNWEVVFETIDSYARYLADRFGWTTPDVRIFYANGSVLEINSIQFEETEKKA